MRRAMIRLAALISVLSVLAVASPARVIPTEATGSGTWSPTGPVGAPGSSSNLVLLPSGKVFQGGGLDTGGHLYDPVANTWAYAGSFEFRFAAAATLMRDGRVLVVGGTAGIATVSPPALVYDPATNGTTPTNPVVAKRNAPGAVLLPNGKVFVVGGSSDLAGSALASTELYDPATNSWIALAPMVTARGAPGVVLLGNGKVLVVGGLTGGSATPVSSAELYDPAADTWSAAGTIATGLDGHTATMLSSGNVLAAGGFDSGTELAISQIYDPTANAWSNAGNMNTARRFGGATLLGDGRVLIAGGLSSGVATASAEVYDPVADVWSVTGSFISARQGPQSTLLNDGRVLAVNGNGESYAEVYDPTRWRTVASPSSPRLHHTATLLWNGKVLVAGGGSATAELYDETADTWSSGGTMSAPRELHAAARMKDGRVLVVGGSDGPNTGSNHLLTAEIYNPATNLWSAAASPTLDHFGQSAVLLNDSRVLIYGLVGDLRPEIYAPATNTWSLGAANPNAPIPGPALRIASGKVVTLDAFSESSLYDPVANTWLHTAAGLSSPYLIAPGSLALLVSGKASLTGGQTADACFESGNGFTSVAATKIFDPVNQSWPSVAAMAVARTGHSALSLYTGKLLVAGGLSANIPDCLTDTYLPSAELYNPTANTWASAGSLAGPRWLHTATLLPSENMVLIGGSDGTATVATTELFDLGVGKDTDGDGYNDGLEVALGQHPFLKCDAMRADMNYDGVVNSGDALRIAVEFGTRPPRSRFDQNADKIINSGDQLRIAVNAGKRVLQCA